MNEMGVCVPILHHSTSVNGQSISTCGVLQWLRAVGSMHGRYWYSDCGQLQYRKWDS